MAMSGGIDSTYAAYLLKKTGYRVVGVTFRLTGSDQCSSSGADTRSCLAGSVDRAKAAAESLSIPHHVLDLHKEFEEQIMAPFIEEYRQGRTPNPCVLCNSRIKFSAFAQWASGLGADKIATGHYAAIGRTNDGYVIKKAQDNEKDQSYFLYAVPGELLSRTLFPLASSTKREATEGFLGLGLWDGPVKESQDVCFVPGNNYRTFLAPFIEAREGPIYLYDGTWMGRHQGIHLYTVGQRRGINVPYRYPLYVLELRIQDNALFVGPKEMLLKHKVTATQATFFCPSAVKTTGKTRYRQRERPCAFSVTNQMLEVNFPDPVSAVSPGQSVVLYHEDLVVGGGIIESAR